MPMRRQLGNAVVTVLDAQPRAVAHVIQWVPAGLLIAAGAGFVWARDEGPGVVPLVLLGCALVLWVWSAWLMLSRSTTLGALPGGFSYVREGDAEPAGSTLLLKMLVEGGFEIVTCGLGALSFQLTYRDGQHWLDRVFRVVAVRSGSRDPMPTPPAPVQPVEGPPTPPAGPAGFSPSQQTLPPTPIPAPQQPRWDNQPVASSQVTPVRPFAPASITPGENPWAASPSAPVFPPIGFASGSAPENEDREAQQETVIIPGGRPHLDATVVDPNPLVPRPDPVLVLDDGQRITVDGPLVLGRNPVAPSNHPGARSVKLVDPTMRLSKTHLVVLAELDGVRVIDVGATNGVFLESDGERTRLVVREPHRLLRDQLIHFGGRTLRLVQ